MKPAEMSVVWLAGILASLSVAATPRALEFVDPAPPVGGKVILPVGMGGALHGLAGQVNELAEGAIAESIRVARFKGDAGQTLTLYGVGPFPAVMLIGVGESPRTALDLRNFGALAAKGSAGWSVQAQVVVPEIDGVPHPAAEAALGVRLGEYDFGKWGAAKPVVDPASAPKPMRFLSPQATAASTAFERDGEAVAAGVWFARDLISTPSNIKTPQWFAEQVRQRFKGTSKVTITVLDERQIQSLGMGALYGTGQGSVRPPRLVAIDYRGGVAGEAPIVLVGKGITFDTGGISIKPSDGMWRMRTDMSGAAAVAGAVLTLAQRNAAVNVVAVLSLAENMPDGNAIRPGDVLTSMSGKTIEVLNTDAEGRLVLADALWWAQQTFKPRVAVTIATLTGAVVRALGPEHAGLFTMSDALADQFIAAGAAVGESLWRLPVTPGTVRAIKSDIADVKNIADGSSAPGASVGAAFIMEWAQPDIPFVHLDIAGTAWDSSGRPTEPKGAVGYGVRLFDEWIRQQATAP